MVYQRNIVTDMNKLLWVVSYIVEKRLSQKLNISAE